MSDSEKVIKGYTCCEIDASCTFCPYFSSNTCIADLRNDVFELLKKQSENVRCKDCKNWIPGWVDDYDTFIPPRCKRNSGVWASSDYCSYVDRKVKQNG